MPTTVLTFWLCLAGTSCDANHAVNGSHRTEALEGYSVIACDEMNALTDDPYIDRVLSDGRALWHTCEAGEGL